VGTREFQRAYVACILAYIVFLLSRAVLNFILVRQLLFSKILRAGSFLN
jgi:hypothetical protein